MVGGKPFRKRDSTTVSHHDSHACLSNERDKTKNEQRNGNIDPHHDGFVDC